MEKLVYKQHECYLYSFKSHFHKDTTKKPVILPRAMLHYLVDVDRCRNGDSLCLCGGEKLSEEGLWGHLEIQVRFTTVSLPPRMSGGSPVIRSGFPRPRKSSQGTQIPSKHGRTPVLGIRTSTNLVQQNRRLLPVGLTGTKAQRDRL